MLFTLDNCYSLGLVFDLGVFVDLRWLWFLLVASFWLLLIAVNFCVRGA